MTEALSGLTPSRQGNVVSGTQSASATAGAGPASAQRGTNAKTSATPTQENTGGSDATVQTASQISVNNAIVTDTSTHVGADGAAKSDLASASAVSAEGAAAGTPVTSDAGMTMAQALNATQGNVTETNANVATVGSAAEGARDAGRSKAGVTGVSGASATGTAGAKSDPKKADGRNQAATAAMAVTNAAAFVAAVAAPGMAQPGAVVAAQSAGRGNAASGAGGVAGRVASRVATVLNHAASPVTVAGNVVTQNDKNVPGPVASGRSAADGGPGTGGVANGAAATAGALPTGIQGPQTAGISSGMQVAAVQGVPGQAGAGQTASAASGMVLTQAHHGKDGAALAASGPGATGGGFTATLLLGQAGAGMSATTVAHAGTQRTAGNPGGTGAANPYARMDGAQQATLTYASPQKMAVTVSDPSLGSFEVRAQSSGAQVAASLATISAATHAQLSGHLPSLTAFLQDQRVDVSRVTVVQRGLLSGDAGARGFNGQQGQSGSGGQRPRSQTSRVAAAGAVGAATGVSGAAGVDGVSGARMSGRGTATMPATSESGRSESNRVDVLA
jgi:hypothetical protein